MAADEDEETDRLAHARERARAHLSRWRVDGEDADRLAALEWCEVLRSLDPDSGDAQEIERSLETRSTASMKLRLASFFVGVGLLSAVAAIATFRVVSAIGDKIEGEKLTQFAEIEWQDYAVGFSLTEEMSDLEGMTFETQYARIQTLEEKDPTTVQLVFAGYLHNNSRWAIESMDVRVEVLDLHGDAVKTVDASVLNTLDPVFRPGDAIPVGIRLEEEASKGLLPQVDHVRITPSDVAYSEPPEAYPEAREVPITWAEEPEAIYGLQVWERDYALGEGYGKGVYLLKNTGRETYGRLKIELIWRNEVGRIVASSATHPLGTIVEFRSGDAFVHEAVFDRPGTDSLPEIRVLEIRY